MPTPVDPNEWVTPSELPARTNGIISLTRAKHLLRDRETNGLGAIGAARLIGRKGVLHLPTVLTRELGLKPTA